MFCSCAFANAAPIEKPKSQIENSNGSKTQQSHEAMEWLNRAAAAYSRVSQLEQKTEFTSALIPLDAPKPGEKPKPLDEQILNRRLHLVFVRPNKLRLESAEPDEAGRQQVTVSVSDGKTFWTYIPEKNWYTKDKAPRNVADFAKLSFFQSSSLEMLMLMGINPFAELKRAATGIRDEGDGTVRETPVRWVKIEMEDPLETTTLRIAIGKADFLIRRVVHERVATASASRQQAAPVDDGLEALRNARRVTLPDQDPTPTQPDAPAPRTMTRLTYDNILNFTPDLTLETFAFTVPPNALRLGEPDKGERKKSDFAKMIKERADVIRRQSRKPQ